MSSTVDTVLLSTTTMEGKEPTTQQRGIMGTAPLEPPIQKDNRRRERMKANYRGQTEPHLLLPPTFKKSMPFQTRQQPPCSSPSTASRDPYHRRNSLGYDSCLDTHPPSHGRVLLQPRLLPPPPPPRRSVSYQLRRPNHHPYPHPHPPPPSSSSQLGQFPHTPGEMTIVDQNGFLIAVPSASSQQEQQQPQRRYAASRLPRLSTRRGAMPGVEILRYVDEDGFVVSSSVSSNDNQDGDHYQYYDGRQKQHRPNQHQRQLSVHSGENAYAVDTPKQKYGMQRYAANVGTMPPRSHNPGTQQSSPRRSNSLPVSSLGRQPKPVAVASLSSSSRPALPRRLSSIRPLNRAKSMMHNNNKHSHTKATSIDNHQQYPRRQLSRSKSLMIGNGGRSGRSSSSSSNNNAHQKFVPQRSKSIHRGFDSKTSTTATTVTAGASTPTMNNTTRKKLKKNRTSRTSSSSSAVVLVEDPNDIWVERIIVNSTSGNCSYFKSVYGNVKRKEPPTGAKNIIYLEDIIDERCVVGTSSNGTGGPKNHVSSAASSSFSSSSTGKNTQLQRKSSLQPKHRWLREEQQKEQQQPNTILINTLSSSSSTESLSLSSSEEINSDISSTSGSSASFGSGHSSSSSGYNSGSSNNTDTASSTCGNVAVDDTSQNNGSTSKNPQRRHRTVGGRLNSFRCWFLTTTKQEKKMKKQNKTKKKVNPNRVR